MTAPPDFAALAREMLSVGAHVDAKHAVERIVTVEAFAAKLAELHAQWTQAERERCAKIARDDKTRSKFPPPMTDAQRRWRDGYDSGAGDAAERIAEAIKWCFDDHQQESGVKCIGHGCGKNGSHYLDCPCHTPPQPAAGTDQHARDERAEAIAVAGPSAGGVATVDGQDAGASTGGAGRDLGAVAAGDPAPYGIELAADERMLAEVADVAENYRSALELVSGRLRVYMDRERERGTKQPQPAPAEDVCPECHSGSAGHAASCSREPKAYQGVPFMPAALSDAKIAEMEADAWDRNFDVQPRFRQYVVDLAAECRRLRESAELQCIADREAARLHSEARADEAQAKLYAAEMKGKWVEARADVERLVKSEQQQIDYKWEENRQRKKAEAALARACELLREANEADSFAEAKLVDDKIESFLAEHGGAK